MLAMQLSIGLKSPCIRRYACSEKSRVTSLTHPEGEVNVTSWQFGSRLTGRCPRQHPGPDGAYQRCPQPGASGPSDPPEPGGNSAVVDGGPGGPQQTPKRQNQRSEGQQEEPAASGRKALARGSPLTRPDMITSSSSCSLGGPETPG